MLSENFHDVLCVDLSLSLDRREEVNRFCMNDTAWIIADSCSQVCLFFLET